MKPSGVESFGVRVLLLYGGFGHGSYALWVSSASRRWFSAWAVSSMAASVFEAVSREAVMVSSFSPVLRRLSSRASTRSLNDL